MGETDLDLHGSYYADLTIQQGEDAMHERQSAGAYSWVNPSRPRRPKATPEQPPESEFDADVPTIKIERPAGATIEEAVLTLLADEPSPLEDPPRRMDHDADPCNCAYCKEARVNQVLYVQYDGSTVLRPLAFIAEMAEVAGAAPMRFCAITGKVIDQDAPSIAPWTTGMTTRPICCEPLRRAVSVERADVPPFGDTISFTGSKGYLLAKRCPWCGTDAPEIIRKHLVR